MYVVTADQIDSRNTGDISNETIARLNALRDLRPLLPIDRAGGDEIQMLFYSAKSALDAILLLTRDGRWSVGCGVGKVRQPLPSATREATGAAFVGARLAVELAKKKDGRFALRSEVFKSPNEIKSQPSDLREVHDAEVLVDLLLQVRSKRSEAGWEIYDILQQGKSQVEAARLIKITPQAASKRARSGGVRVEIAAQPAVIRALERAHEVAEQRESSFSV